MRGKSSGLLGTDYGDYVSQAPLCSFLVSTGFLRAFMTRYERKSMLYRHSSLEVSKMCQLAEKKRGSKPRIPLLARSCFMETSDHTVGKAQTAVYKSSTGCSLGRNTETEIFSALVIAQEETPLILNTPSITPCIVITERLGGMDQNLSENDSHFFHQITQQQSANTLPR